MPVKEFECKKCGRVFERLCGIKDNTFQCSVCGETCGIKYTGKCNGYKSGAGGCGGNCGCCKGCK